MKEFNIANHVIGGENQCFVIAEVGSNHNNDYNQAIELINAAAESGVDAVKFQTFKASSHYSKKTPNFDYLGDVDTYNLIHDLELNRAWHKPLKDYSESIGLVFLSSPCDLDAIVELDNLGIEAFKLASFDLPDLTLVKEMAKTKKPLIFSTGMANWMDIQRAIDVARNMGNYKIALLQCTSLYPAPAKLSNLRSMKVMQNAFNVITGYSDHTLGDHICLAAVANGASIIEKHLTLDRSMAGPDHKFAIEPNELKQLMYRLREVESALGEGMKNGPRLEEKDMFNKGRRSIHAACDIFNGEVVTENMLTIKRPGLGISPYLQSNIIGRVALQDIKKDEWITWEMI